MLLASQLTNLQQTAMLGGSASIKTSSYSLIAADAGSTVAMNSASSTTITVNQNLFSAGDIVTIYNTNTGVSTLTAGTATVTTSGSLALSQNQGGVLHFTSASAAIFFQFATPASGDIEGVTAGTGISGGGTSGTVTITNSMATAIDAKGDLVAGTGADAFSRLAVGSNNTVLTADSAEATGLKWAAAAGASGPAFSVTRITSNQSLTQNTYTKLQWNSEDFDTANAFDSTTNYRFTPLTAGYYQINVIAWIDQNNATFANSYLGLYKNGSIYKTLSGLKLENYNNGGSVVVYLNGSSDYLEVFGYSTTAAGSFRSTAAESCFSGVWIRS